MRIAILAYLVALGCGGEKRDDGKMKGGGGERDEKDPLVDPDLAVPDEPGRNMKVELPTVPAFELPAPYPDGSRTVRELRVAGKKFLDTEVAVTGFVTWVYDCVDANRSPDRSEAETRKMVEADPTLCERPKFYLGDAVETPPEDSLWVVEVPRPYTALEVKHKMPETDPHPRRCLAGAKDDLCPPRKIGDKVTVTGRFALESPSGERTGDGLMIYVQMVNHTAAWRSPKPIVESAPPVPTPREVKAPEAPIEAKPGPVHQVRRSVRTKSIAIAEEAAQAMANVQLAVAITKYQNAVEVWPGNHTAWSALAAGYAKKKEWKRASDTIDRALRLVPDAAMYHLQQGWYRYEAALAAERNALAARRGVKPEQVSVDPSTVDLSSAERHLATAVRLGPQLWRAHFLLGRVHLAAGRARAAAEAFTTAAARGAPEAAPWIQLGELYRRWDLHDLAIKVADRGVDVVASEPDKADLCLLAGLALEAKHQDDQAIARFSAALERRKDHAQATFMRGQTYFRKKDFAKARRDLEDVVKPGRVSEFFRQQAARMLAEIAAAK